MSVPRGTYLVTRSTVMGLFLLTPSGVVNQVVEYCVAWAALGRGIAIHAVSVQSNHYHLVVTDLEGELSEFVREFNRCVARCLLAYYRKRFPRLPIDALWTPGQSFSAQLLLTRNAILDKILYTLTNAVTHGLVRHFRQWPGFHSSPADWKTAERTVQRPDFYFTDTPETLTYRIERPTQLDGDLDALIVGVDAQISDRERAAAAELAAQKRRVIGVNAILATSPLAAPATPQPLGNLNPHLAAGGDTEALRTATTALRLFRSAYRVAWQLFKSGVQTVFPGGTLLLRKRFQVPCDPLDTSWCLLA